MPSTGPGAASGIPDAGASPLSVFLGFDTAGEQRLAEIAEMERAAGRLTAECMLEKGFEYVPPTVGAPGSFEPPGDELLMYSDAWIDRYGFGVSTMRFSQESVGSNLVGFVGSGAEGVEFEDPNQAFVEALSETEAEAYHAALYGLHPDFIDGVPTGETTPGCLDTAFASVFDTQRQIAFHETFGLELDELHQRVDADPRVAEHRRTVSDCVQAAGHAWSPGQDVYQLFGERLAEIGPDWSVDPFEAAGLDQAEMSQQEIDAFIRSFDVLTDQDRAILAEIQAEEIELAKVVDACNGGPRHEQRFLTQIRNEYEQRFLDSNADRLRDFGAQS